MRISWLCLPLLSACATGPTDTAIDRWVQAHPDRILAALQRNQLETHESHAANVGARMGKTVNADLVPASAPILGRRDAAHTIVYFFDPTCSACRQSSSELVDFVKRNSDTRLVLRPIPIIHPGSARPIAAWELAATTISPERALEIHELIMAPDGGDGTGARATDQERLDSIAAKLHLQASQIQQSATDPRFERIMDENIAFARRVGIDSTPLYWIDGKVFPGGLTQGALATAIGASAGIRSSSTPQS